MSECYVTILCITRTGSVVYDNMSFEMSADNVKLGDKVQLLESLRRPTSGSSVLLDNSQRHLDDRQLLDYNYVENMISHNHSLNKLLNVDWYKT